MSRHEVTRLVDSTIKGHIAQLAAVMLSHNMAQLVNSILEDLIADTAGHMLSRAVCLIPLEGSEPSAAWFTMSTHSNWCRRSVGAVFGCNATLFLRD